MGSLAEHLHRRGDQIKLHAREHPLSSVALVSGDLNLQVKAEFAELSFIEPPDTP